MTDISILEFIEILGPVTSLLIAILLISAFIVDFMEYSDSVK